MGRQAGREGRGLRGNTGGRYSGASWGKSPALLDAGPAGWRAEIGSAGTTTTRLKLSARLPARLPARPPACLPACLPARLQPHLCVKAVDGLPVLALLLEGSKHAVPDDQDASVVPASRGFGGRGQGRCVNLVGCNRSQQQTAEAAWLAARQAEHGRLGLPAAAAAAAAAAGARGRHAHLRP